MSNTKSTIVLGDEFNEQAKDLADLQRIIDMTKKKLNAYSKKMKADINRLSMYIINQFFKGYKFEEHIILFRRDLKIEFQKLKDVELAKKKYEELQDAMDDSWLDDELSMVTDNGLLVSFEDVMSMNDDSDLENYYHEYDNIKKYLPPSKHVYSVSKNQMNELKNLLLKCNNPQYKFLVDKLDSLQSTYLETVDEVLDMIDSYDIYFNIETDEVVTARDDDDMTWHLYLVRDLSKYNEDDDF